ncbi:hypothetical protein RyT2_03840 [Pseudolactococcus yaeyamensis]
MKRRLKQKLAQIPFVRKQYMRLKGNQFYTPMTKYQDDLLMSMMPTSTELDQMASESKHFAFQPLISVIMPTYNTDLKMLDEAIKSVQLQVYSNWELIIVDDCSPNQIVRESISNYVAKDNRIKSIFLSENHHIAGATNQGFKIAQGDYIALFDHDDYLYPNALYENVKAINQYPKIKFLYSDEDKIDELGNRHFDAYLKPDFNFDFLRCMNIITHFVLFKKELWLEFDGEDAKYNGAQDWEFVMRLTNDLSPKEIYHIDKVIYSWRVHSGSTAMETGAKPYVPEAQRNLLRKDLENRKQFGVKVYENYEALGQWLFQYPIIGNPLVSILIDASESTKHLEELLNSIFIKTSYFNFEVIVKNANDISDKYKVKHDNLTETITGDYVIVINPDFEILTFDWIEKMLGQAQRDGIAYVMPRIVRREHNYIESVGLAVTQNGEVLNLLNSFNTLGHRTLTEHIHLTTHHYVTGVNPNCYMVSKDLFDETEDVVRKSIEVSQNNSYNVFVSDVQIKNNSLVPLNKSFGKYDDLVGFRDKTTNTNFLEIERNYKRGEKI